jgi:GntR family transcriptional regulator
MRPGRAQIALGHAENSVVVGTERGEPRHLGGIEIGDVTGTTVMGFGPPNPGMISLCVAVRRVDQWYNNLAARSGRRDHAPDPHPGALPAYLRIAEHLTIEIGTGRLAPGDRLPTERSLAARYGVSMMTLSKALAVVTERGLIARGRARATTCSAAQNVGHLRALPAGGGAGRRRVAHGGTALDFDTMPKPEDLAGIGAPRTPPHPPPAPPRRRPRRGGGDLARHPFRPPEARASVGIALQDLCREAGPHHHPGGGSGRHRPLPDWAPKHCVLRPAPRWDLSNGAASINTATPAEASRSWFDPDRARYVARVP